MMLQPTPTTATPTTAAATLRAKAHAAAIRAWIPRIGTGIGRPELYDELGFVPCKDAEQADELLHAMQLDIWGRELPVVAWREPPRFDGGMRGWEVRLAWGSELSAEPSPRPNTCAVCGYERHGHADTCGRAQCDAIFASGLLVMED